MSTLDKFNYWNDPRVVASMTTSYWRVVKVGYSTCCIEFQDCFFEHLVEMDVFSSEDSPRKEYPGTWQICNMCQGSGRVVNPSVDAGGISEDDWQEWCPDEREAYFSGRYDINCPECRGSGKNLHPKFPVEIQTHLDEWDQEEMRYAQISAAERAYGC